MSKKCNGGTMKVIKRDIYLNKLIDSKENTMVKVITGIRRCGKSYLLFNLYYDHLKSIGVKDENIIRIALDDEQNEDLKDPKVLGSYIRKQIKNSDMYYIFLDEIQLVGRFEPLLNGLNRIENTDVYVTGSNSKFLSSDILTEFRGRGHEIRVYPLCFREFSSAYSGTIEEAWDEFVIYGGLPNLFNLKTSEKSNYLLTQFEKTYFADIIERNNLQKDSVLEAIVNILASSIGSLTNPAKLARTFESSGIKGVSEKTISSYINHLIDAFIIRKVERYDIKGKKYISTPSKYYFCDIGLRNARLNFRQQEENHIMENIIYNELLVRGLNVDVGVVEHRTTDSKGKTIRKQYEVDFVCNQESKRYYIQSALNLDTYEKTQQEQNSLIRVDDAFKKIIIVKNRGKHWRTEKGVVVINVLDFLLDPNSLDL